MQIPHISRTTKIISIAVVSVLLVIGILVCITGTVANHTKNTRYEGARYKGMDHTMMGHNGIPSNTMEDMSMSSLQGKTGDAFDKAFLEEMIVHHKGAIDMAYMVKATSKKPELLQLADEIIAAQTKEISQMEMWLSVWFK